MKILNNKIFSTIIFIIILLFSLQLYYVIFSYKIDVNSYISLLKGSGEISYSGSTKNLELNHKKIIKSGDIISIKENSIAVIEWGDKSITRLSGLTKVTIKENYVSEDLKKINISLELLKGKSWSNVISILGDDSYFKLDIKNVTASVRGTVFEANYDDDYIGVYDHRVDVKNKDGEIKTVESGKIIKLNSFIFGDLKEIIDKTWIKLNQDLDKEYLNQLREAFIKSINNKSPYVLIKDLFNKNNDVVYLLNKGENISNINKLLNKLPEDKKQEAIKKIEYLSQTLNFENGQDSKLYNLKLNTRELLISNTQDESLKKLLIKYSVYDLGKMIDDSVKVNNNVLEYTKNFLNKNKTYIDLQNNGYSFQEKFKSYFSKQIFKYDGNELIENVGKLNEKSVELLDKTINNIFDKIKK